MTGFTPAETNNTQTQQATATPVPQPQMDIPVQPSAMKPADGVGVLNATGLTSFYSGGGNDLVRRFIDTYNKARGAQISAAGYRLVEIDGNKFNGGWLSGIAVCYFMQNNQGNKTVWVYTLLAAGTAPSAFPINTRTAVGGTRYQYQTTPGDVYTQQYFEGVKSIIAALDPSVKSIYDVGNAVIHKYLSPEDINGVCDVINMACHACSQVYLRSVGNTKGAFHVDMFNKDIEVPTVKVTNHLGGVTHRDGRPIHSHTSIDLLVSNPKVQNNSGEAFGIGEKLLARTEGFVSFAYANPPAQQNNYGQIVQASQRFVATYNITDVRVDAIGFNPINVLLCIYLATFLGEGNLWASSFFRSQQQDPAMDLGLLGYDLAHLYTPQGQAPVPQALDTSGYGIAELNNFIQTAIFPGLNICLHVPMHDESTWYTMPFLNIANLEGDAANKSAIYKSIYNAADYLCNGRLKSKFPYGAMITRRGDYIVPNGVVQHRGRPVDVRSNTYLAMLERNGKQDLALCKDFEQQMVGGRDAPDIWSRLERTVSILTQSYGANLEITGYSVPVYFTKAFLNALGDSIRSEYFQPQTKNINNQLAGQQRRGFELVDAITGVGSQGLMSTASNPVSGFTMPSTSQGWN